MNSFKTFNDFGTGLEEIVSIVPDIKAVCSSINEDVTAITPKELSAALAEVVMNDFPYIDFRSPAISISYKEVGFKSRSSLSFGWKYVVDGSGKMSYSFRISYFSRANYVLEIEKKLKEAGWEQPPERRSFFPYKNNFRNKKEFANNKKNTKKPPNEQKKVATSPVVKVENVEEEF